MEDKIKILLCEWERFKTTPASERALDFEQQRLRTIEKIATAFVDYYNQNKYSKPYSLKIITDNSLGEEKMEPNMEQVIKKIMETAISGDRESQKLCLDYSVDTLIRDKNLKTHNETSFEDTQMNISPNFSNPHSPIGCSGINPPTPYFYCDTLKQLVLSVIKHKPWVINDVKFSDKGNLESINIKFASEFTLGNSPWDPR